MPEKIINGDAENNDGKDALLENNSKNDGQDLLWKHSLKQILAACIAHCLVIQAGINMTFSAVLLPQLNADDSDIVIDLHQASWIASCVTAALPLGSLIIGPLMDKFGRKNMCMFTTVPFAISWSLHIFATNVWFIYVARIVAGFGAGLSTVGLVYVSEISHPKYRPMLLTFNSVGVTLGILITCVLGYGLHWTSMVKIFLALVVVTGIGVYFLPESPYWLMVFKNDKKKLADSLQWLYPETNIFIQQYDRIVYSTYKEEDSQIKSKLQHMKENLLFCKSPIVWKPLAILLIIFIFQQFSSAYVIVFYAVDIFKRIGAGFKHIGFIDEYVALILLGGVRFLMAIILAMISKRVGRRLLMFISSVGMIITSFALALLMQLTENTHETGLMNVDGTVAIVLVLAYICFSSFGWLVIPWTLIGELLPVKVRGVLGGLLISIVYILMFLLVKVAPFLMESVSLVSIFYGLSVINLVGFAFLYKFLPETLGKTFEDIATFFDEKIRR
ncbi:unnamed protein product [Ceutorhynchus assimilis]|uniref:Major facilitator superfamily (MFS) profile domain-containing protein n=1 Tax=Ceutorhynchus assimilis TaxID=467358 RepID=A0A9P0GQ65_9CUCU|nr:unnamed protein product [Ceutorhynchus assimilis]